ncbi:MAG: hypothetical protein WAK01_03170 [Methylocystis sp.]
MTLGIHTSHCDAWEAVKIIVKRMQGATAPGEFSNHRTWLARRYDHPNLFERYREAMDALESRFVLVKH